MRASLDFVSEETGETLLHAALDAAPHGLTREDSWEIVKVLRKTRKQLEKICCRPVRLSLDSWEATLFWYLVLFRPIAFDKQHVLYGKKKWSAYDLLKSPQSSNDLKMTDLGLFVDHENMLVVLYWPEAVKGICSDLGTCPSWQKVMSEHKDRTGRVLDDTYLEKCARSFAYALPHWHLSKLGYPRRAFFKKDAVTRDFIALDMAGIDVPMLGAGTSVATMPVAKRARFAHFYVEDEREYRAVVQLETESYKKFSKGGKRVIQGARRKDLQKAARTKERDAEQKEKGTLYQISRAIFGIPRILGGDNPMGRSVKFLSIKKSDELFMSLVTLFINGEYANPKWDRLQVQVELIENLLSKNDPHVPEEFWKWTWWKNKAERVRMEFEGR
jgi:hypothetical protein